MIFLEMCQKNCTLKLPETNFECESTDNASITCSYKSTSKWHNFHHQLLIIQAILVLSTVTSDSCPKKWCNDVDKEAICKATDDSQTFICMCGQGFKGPRCQLPTSGSTVTFPPKHFTTAYTVKPTLPFTSKNTIVTEKNSITMKTSAKPITSESHSVSGPVAGCTQRPSLEKNISVTTSTFLTAVTPTQSTVTTVTTNSFEMNGTMSNKQKPSATSGITTSYRNFSFGAFTMTSKSSFPKLTSKQTMTVAVITDSTMTTGYSRTMNGTKTSRQRPLTTKVILTTSNQNVSSTSTSQKHFLTLTSEPQLTVTKKTSNVNRFTDVTDTQYTNTRTRARSSSVTQTRPTAFKGTVSTSPQFITTKNPKISLHTIKATSYPNIHIGITTKIIKKETTSDGKTNNTVPFTTVQNTLSQSETTRLVSMFTLALSSTHNQNGALTNMSSTSLLFNTGATRWTVSSKSKTSDSSLTETATKPETKTINTLANKTTIISSTSTKNHGVTEPLSTLFMFASTSKSMKQITSKSTLSSPHISSIPKTTNPIQTMSKKSATILHKTTKVPFQTTAIISVQQSSTPKTESQITQQTTAEKQLSSKTDSNIKSTKLQYFKTTPVPYTFVSTSTLNKNTLQSTSGHDSSSTTSLNVRSSTSVLKSITTSKKTAPVTGEKLFGLFVRLFDLTICFSEDNSCKKDENSCLNNGTCVLSSEGYICECQGGYGGPSCEDGMNSVFIINEY